MYGEIYFGFSKIDYSSEESRVCLLPKYSHFNINTTRFSSSGLICLRFQKYILPLEFRKLKIDFNYSLRVCSTKDCFETNVPL